MLFERKTTIFIRLMKETDKKDFDRFNKKYEEEISKYCQDGASIWEWEDFVHDPFRAGYMICLKNPDNMADRISNKMPYKKWEKASYMTMDNTTDLGNEIPLSDDYDMEEPYESPHYTEEINVGFILCDYDDYTWNGSCYIQQFYVDEAFRRKGVGILAVNELLEKEWKLTLHVMKNNEPAQRFWRAVKQELNLDDWCEENFLKMETTDEFCDFFYWENRKMRMLLDGADIYRATAVFPAGGKIYRHITELKVRKHEVFDAWYDIFDRFVIINDDEITGRIYYMILDGEDSIVVFHDRTQVYVITDSDVIHGEELFESLVIKADRMKEYLTAFQRWQRENCFFTRNKEYKSSWEDEEEELSWDDDEDTAGESVKRKFPFKRSEMRYGFRQYPFERNRRRRVRRFSFCENPVRGFHRNIKRWYELEEE